MSVYRVVQEDGSFAIKRGRYYVSVNDCLINERFYSDDANGKRHYYQKDRYGSNDVQRWRTAIEAEIKCRQLRATLKREQRIAREANDNPLSVSFLFLGALLGSAVGGLLVYFHVL